MNGKNQIRAASLPAYSVSSDCAPGSATRQRLRQSFSRLQYIQLVRSLQQDSLFGKFAEDRIIWRELVELELQYVDEQIERISTAAGGRSGSTERSGI